MDKGGHSDDAFHRSRWKVIGAPFAKIALLFAAFLKFELARVSTGAALAGTSLEPGGCRARDGSLPPWRESSRR